MGANAAYGLPRKAWLYRMWCRNVVCLCNLRLMALCAICVREACMLLAVRGPECVCSTGRSSCKNCLSPNNQPVNCSCRKKRFFAVSGVRSQPQHSDPACSASSSSFRKGGDPVVTAVTADGQQLVAHRLSWFNHGVREGSRKVFWLKCCKLCMWRELM